MLFPLFSPFIVTLLRSPSLTTVKVKCYNNACQAQNSAMQSAFFWGTCVTIPLKACCPWSQMRQITETIKYGSCCYVRCHMSKRQQLHLRDKRGTRHRRLQPHHTEKKECFASSMQHSRTHYNAICNRMLQNTTKEPITRQNDRSRNRLTTELPLIAGANHFTPKNTMLRASSPTPVPCSHSTAICNRRNVL